MPAAEPAAAVPPAPAAGAVTAVVAPVFDTPREAPIAAPVAPERAREVRAPAPPPPQIDVDSALRESGLVMIETSRDKAQAAAPVEEVQAPRVRRERRPPPPDLDTPLQQVETTRKSDSESQPPR
jgi:ribonuclease E